MDVRLKRLNLPEQNKQSVYARMRAERERIARQYRAEGEEQALRIRAEADRKREEILAKAYKEAETTKGEGDAQAARIYGAAYSRNQSFYKLTRTLEAYRKALDEDTTVILSADSELLRLMTRGSSREMHQHSPSTPTMQKPAYVEASQRLRSLSTRHIAAALAAVWLLAGIYVVPTEEQAVLTTFGALANDQVTPGVGWHFPWPVGRVHKLKVRELKRAS